MLPLADPEAGTLLTGLTEAELFTSWRLAGADGSLVGYGTGAVRLLETMALTRRAARVLARVPDPILDSSYRLVARHREKLGRLVSDRPGPKRFP